jgi:phage antirepressor YoqD-like protein
MERIGEEQTMSVKEVADVLGYEPETLRKKVKELFPESVENGKATMLSELQVVKLKENLFPRTPALKSGVENAVTEIEKQQTIMLAMQYLQENLIAMKERAIKAERKNAILMHVSKTYTAGEIAKELGMRSAQELNQALADKGIQYKQNGTWLPTADNSSCGYFEIKQQELESGKVIYDRRITQTGREFILSLFEEGER